MYEFIYGFGKYQDLFELTSAEKIISGGFLNRAVYVSADSQSANSGRPMIHDGAAQQMSFIIDELSNVDFVVVDVILTRKSLDKIYNILLTSTIWYDTSNGQAFVTHKDDGLVHSSFSNLANEIANSLSNELIKFRARKYYTIAMKLSSGIGGRERSSPVMTGLHGELAIVLWINPGIYFLI